MANLIVLAKHKRILNQGGEEKFCHGECQKLVPKKDFPKNGERICKACQSAKYKKQYADKKKEKELYDFL